MSNRIITISREFGSGGRTIGKKLGEKLGIPCYDAELIRKIAEESGYAEDFIVEKSESTSGGWISNLFTDRSIGQSTEDSIWLIQSKVILELAEKGSCVIVGRCADYALEDNPDMISVFITGDEESKIQHIMETYEYNYNNAKDYMQKTDKRRANYYNYYANKKWGAASTYDLCLNRSKLGFDGCVEAIVDFIRLRQRQKKEEAKTSSEEK